MTTSTPKTAEAVERLKAWASLIERPPKDDLSVDANTAETHAADIRLVLQALSTAQQSDARVREALEEIAAERRRQIEVEGWTPHHDDGWTGGELAIAAAAYAGTAGAHSRIPVSMDVYRTATTDSRQWPWQRKWWKPTTPRRDLIKAAALIVAEIERLDRAALKAEG